MPSPARRARPRLGGIATHHFDGVSSLGGKAADRCGLAASADDADSAHVQQPLGLLGAARTPEQPC